jgi:hypothetical protein
VKTPRLYYFSNSTHTQIYSDLPSSLDLKTYVLTHPLSKEQCERVGQGIGLWARHFHAWAIAPQQQGIVDSMKGNTEMRDLKFRINYENLVATIDNFPHILGGARDVFEKVRDDIRARQEKGEGQQLIHGDFWSGK